MEKILESPLDCKEIQPVHPKGNQSWIFIGRTDAEAPILWPPDVKSWLIGKDPDAGKDWRLEGKGMTEDEMVGWHHRLDGHEFEQALGRQWRTGKPGVLQSMGYKESDTTERLNNHHHLWDFCVRRIMVTAWIPISLFPKYIETWRAQIRPHMTPLVLIRRQNTTNFKLPQNPRELPLPWQTYGNITQAPETLQKEKGPKDTDEAQAKSPAGEGGPTSNAEITLWFCSLHHWWHIKTTATKTQAQTSSTSEEEADWKRREAALREKTVKKGNVRNRKKPKRKKNKFLPNSLHYCHDSLKKVLYYFDGRHL